MAELDNKDPKPKQAPQPNAPTAPVYRLDLTRPALTITPFSEGTGKKKRPIIGVGSGGRTGAALSDDVTKYLEQGTYRLSTDPYYIASNRQSAMDALGTKAINAAWNIPAGILESVGYMGSLATEWGDEKDYSNWLTEAMAASKDPFGKVLVPQPGTNDYGSSKWWIDTLGSLGESVAQFAALGWIGGAILGEGAAYAAEAAGWGAKGLGISQKIAQGLTATYLGYTEGAMSGAQVYKEVYQQEYDRIFKMTGDRHAANEQAKHLASQSAATTVQLSTALTSALNFTAVAPFFSKSDDMEAAARRILQRGVGETRAAWRARVMAEVPEGSDLFKYLNKANNWKHAVKHTLGEAVQEGTEEVVNQFAEETGRALGKQGKEKGFLEQFTEIENFYDRTMNEDGALNFALGAVGGVGTTLLLDHVPMHRVPYDKNGVQMPLMKEGKLVLDEKGNPKYKYRMVSSAQRADHQARTAYSTLKEATLQDLDRVEKTYRAMEKAADAKDKVRLEALQAQLFNTNALNSVYLGTEQSWVNEMEGIRNVDNTQDLGTLMQPQIDELSEQITQTEDPAEQQALQNQLDDLLKKQQQVAGKTAAMQKGLAKDTNDNAYKDKAARAITQIKTSAKLYNKLRNLYDDKRPDTEQLIRYMHAKEMNLMATQDAVNEEKKSLAELKADFMGISPEAATGVGEGLQRVAAYESTIQQLVEDLKDMEHAINNPKDAARAKKVDELLTKYNANDHGDLNKSINATAELIGKEIEALKEKQDVEAQVVQQTNEYQAWAEKGKSWKEYIAKNRIYPEVAPNITHREQRLAQVEAELNVGKAQLKELRSAKGQSAFRKLAVEMNKKDVADLEEKIRLANDKAKMDQTELAAVKELEKRERDIMLNKYNKQMEKLQSDLKALKDQQETLEGQVASERKSGDFIGKLRSYARQSVAHSELDTLQDKVRQKLYEIHQLQQQIDAVPALDEEIVPIPVQDTPVDSTKEAETPETEGAPGASTAVTPEQEEATRAMTEEVVTTAEEQYEREERQSQANALQNLRRIWAEIGNTAGRSALEDGWAESFTYAPEAIAVGGEQYAAHGMGKSSFGSALSDLVKLFETGIDPSRGGGKLYTDALVTSEKGTGAATGTAGGTAYMDGAFVLVAKHGVTNGIQSINDIGGILVNSGLTALNPDIVLHLQQLFPNLIVEDYSNMKRMVEQLNAQAGVEFQTAPADPLVTEPPTMEADGAMETEETDIAAADMAEWLKVVQDIIDNKVQGRFPKRSINMMAMDAIESRQPVSFDMFAEYVLTGAISKEDAAKLAMAVSKVQEFYSKELVEDEGDIEPLIVEGMTVVEDTSEEEEVDEHRAATDSDVHNSPFTGDTLPITEATENMQLDFQSLIHEGLMGTNAIKNNTLMQDYTEVQEGGSFVKRSVTSEINHNVSDLLFIPGAIEVGREVIFQVDPLYKGGVNLENFNLLTEEGERQQEQEDSSFYMEYDPDTKQTRVSTMGASIDNVPIKIIDKQTGEQLGYLPRRKWVETRYEGAENYRNIRDEYTDQFGNLVTGNVAKQVSILRDVRSAVVQAYNEGKPPVETKVSAHEGGQVILNIQKNTGKTISASASLLLPDKSLKFALLTRQGMKVDSQTMLDSSNLTNGALGLLNYLQKNSNTRAGAIAALLPMPSGKTEFGFLIPQKLGAQDVATVVHAIEVYLHNNPETGSDGEVAPEWEERREAIEDATGFNVATEDGLRQFIRQYYTHTEGEADTKISKDPRTMDEPVESVFTFGISDKSGDYARGKIKVGYTYSGQQPLLATLVDGKLDPKFIIMLANGLKSRYRTVAFSAGGKLKGLNSEEALTKVTYDPTTGELKKKTYEGYNEFLKAHTFTKVYGKNQVKGQYVYGVHSSIQYEHTNLIHAAANFEGNEDFGDTFTEEEGLSEDWATTNGVKSNLTWDDSWSDEWNKPSFAAKTYMPTAAIGTLSGKELTLENLHQLYNFTPAETRNGRIPEEVFQSLSQEGINRLVDGYNPFKGTCEF